MDQQKEKSMSMVHRDSLLLFGDGGKFIASLVQTLLISLSVVQSNTTHYDHSIMEEANAILGPARCYWAEMSNSSSSSSSNMSERSSKYKGVVAQPNGHWGAQIYTQHQRVWLGTFKSEREAAAAYDSAAVSLRGRPTHRNIPWTSVTAHEPDFQAHFTPDVVLAMIKDGSYAGRFSDYLRANHHQDPTLPGPNNQALDIRFRQLFQKELTPSDVGKLNRLVVPKKYALKFLPQIPNIKDRSNNNNNNNDNNNVDDLELVFFERCMRKSWKLRYCYWKSSQSFVFTRGWNRFAKEKKLRARDRVIFSLYEAGDQKLSVIDVAYFEGFGPVEDKVDGEGEFMEDAEEEPQSIGEIAVVEEGKNISSMVEVGLEEAKGFRLFGFQIV
ncbi:AP2/ERF and B3 domain-containing transcription factor [Striga hermonthica]|uniref:AP2/ERF and B3 domain-containing transcription factor n=1 Tax=Striga hermonthica TaxID=68872 RepID=A0A9N7NRI6_STRHE|nr:AP2/ERF and B3 domain-containing transcription factor [Striga hermonthica]